MEEEAPWNPPGGLPPPHWPPRAVTQPRRGPKVTNRGTVLDSAANFHASKRVLGGASRPEPGQALGMASRRETPYTLQKKISFRDLDIPVRARILHLASAKYSRTWAVVFAMPGRSEFVRTPPGRPENVKCDITIKLKRPVSSRGDWANIEFELRRRLSEDWVQEMVQGDQIQRCGMRCGVLAL
jgi:hypothetical protein